LKLRGESAHIVTIELDVLLRCGWRALSIVSFSGKAEADHPFIGLFGVGVELRQTGEIAEDDGRTPVAEGSRVPR